MAKLSSMYFVRCKVSPGLFDSERQVVLQLPSGKEYVAFVDARNVQVSPHTQPAINNPIDGWVRVLPVAVSKETAVVDLPQGSFTEGPRIQIPSKELRVEQ
jgi:hypothetical protein